jgi:hypothetical protein
MDMEMEKEDLERKSTATKNRVTNFTVLSKPDSNI